MFLLNRNVEKAELSEKPVNDVLKVFELIYLHVLKCLKLNQNLAAEYNKNNNGDESKKAASSEDDEENDSNDYNQVN